MKKSIIILSLGLILLFGCKPEPPTPIAVNPDNQNPESLTYVLTSDGENPVWEAMDLTEFQGNSEDNAASKQGNSVHTHGDIFSGFGGNYDISWSGTENNGGTHGGGELYKSSSSGIFHFVFETECIMDDGNEAVYVGIITEIIEKTGGGPPVQVGWSLFFKVIDNGQGANAPADLYGNLLGLSPNSTCGVWTPDFFFWNLVGTSPVNAPGSVKINN
ncbi:hypothetical protein N9933_02065 [bacterium]|nr:hypothetical protein [bacterium]